MSCFYSCKTGKSVVLKLLKLKQVIYTFQKHKTFKYTFSLLKNESTNPNVLT